MQGKNKPHQPVAKNRTKQEGRKRKRPDKTADISAESLFLEKELVSQ
jgi:hypothetical protein